MIRNLWYPGMLMGATLIFSCQKVNNLNEEFSDKPAKQNQIQCDLNSFSFSTISTDQTIFTVYRISGQAIRVDAGVFSGGAINTTATFNISYVGKSIFFTDVSNPGDTVLAAQLNDLDKIEKIVAGNKPDPQFPSMYFQYNNSSITSMQVSIGDRTESSVFKYDGKGNCTAIEDMPSPGISVPGKVVYEYSNKKASRQFYLDEPRRFSWNSFTLLQYLGYFPELNPTQVRTITKVWWGNNYMAYDATLQNHVFDNDGKLLRYEAVNPSPGNPPIKYELGWNCGILE